MSKQTILVTGASGFIATNYIRMFKDNYNIVGIDKQRLSAKDKDGFKFHLVDLIDREILKGLFKMYKFDYVINFAAEANVDDSITNPEKHVQNNIVGTLNLIEECRMHFNLKRFHQVSTDEVYGDVDLHESISCTEEDILEPGNPYSVTKASADMMIQTYGRMYNLPYTITRCTNNYGPYQTIDKLIPRMITRCMQGKSLTVHGNGLYMRDWLHVDDHCRAIDLVLSAGANGEIYNISSNQEYSNIDIIKWIANLMDYSEDNIVFEKDRLGNDRRYYIDSTKIATDLFYKSKKNIDEELEEVCKWYIENDWWWMPQLEV